jgi:predicted phosphate transport protein (TIGR00153 family)
MALTIDTYTRQLRRIFHRDPDRFLLQLREQATLVLCGTDALMAFMREPSKKNAARVRVCEKKADDVRRALIYDLSQSFVTPIDREDLFALSRSIDDILDYAYATIHEVEALAVTPDTYLCQMVEILHTGAVEIHRAVEQLEPQPRAADEHAIRAKALENQMEALYTHALADLFNTPTDLAQVMDILKLREVYRHLLHAAQSIGLAANRISDLVMKFY